MSWDDVEAVQLTSTSSVWPKVWRLEHYDKGRGPKCPRCQIYRGGSVSPNLAQYAVQYANDSMYEIAHPRYLYCGECLTQTILKLAEAVERP